jgi:N-methylhydantoinase A
MAVSAPPLLHVAVDIGGTFTDLVVYEPSVGCVRTTKVPTSPAAPETAVLEAIEKGGVVASGVGVFLHGTTLGINTLLERKGSPCSLITTRGFRDILEIGRMNWPMYRLHWARPEPLVPRRLRAEVTERVLADGTVVAPLDEDELEKTVRRLVQMGARSLAVCFLNSYAYPEHERRAGALLEEAFPDLPVSLSHVLTREYREYERTATAVVDAVIKPRVSEYLGGMSRRLRAEGFAGRLLVTRSDGGVMSVQEASRRSVRTLLSGPASGVMGVAALARDLGLSHVISADMGGTSFDAALLVDGDPMIASLTHVERVPLTMPVVDMATIGAGGGSIAAIDSGGSLRVGPESAGADPGPMCYGRGGNEPTFTDAAVVSGLLDPGSFLGGELPLDAAAARRGIDAIAARLGISTAEAASGIVALAEARMASTLEEITVGKGYDPRECALVAYGGCGPLVASSLAGRLEVPKVVIPRSPALFSAWGMLTLDEVHDFARTWIGRLEELTREAILGEYRDLEARAAETFERDGVRSHCARVSRSIDMRYENQEHTLVLRLEPDPEATRPEVLRRAFDSAHEATYGYSMPDPVEVVSYRVRAAVPLEKAGLSRISGGNCDASRAATGTRQALHGETGGLRTWTVYDRALLSAGDELSGPALVAEPSATTLVVPSQSCAVDEWGNLLLGPAGVEA